MRILAIETSCDETAAAVVENGRTPLSNVVATQIDLHRRYGGVFPEVASRQHVLAIQPVIRQALAEAGIAHAADLDALAVTRGPGLAGSLLVGVNAAKGLAFAAGLPLIPVNHLEGHVYSNWVNVPGKADGVMEDRFPALVLIVSGGHTELILMREHCRYAWLGGTLDDAAGEAFDKVARLLGLGFPGGPAIQEAAARGDAARFRLPRALLHDPAHRFDFSFSGLKTAVINLVRQLEESGESLDPTGAGAQLVADLAASFQAAVADVLVEKLAAAAVEQGAAQVCICGGVSANAALRFAARARFEDLGLPLYIPPLFLCTDNAAMIGAAAFFRWQADGPSATEGLGLDVAANLPLV
jgi:N6-L-threonylcarbamoyladenine synthase